jgi:chromosome segregation ATPase
MVSSSNETSNSQFMEGSIFRVRMHNFLTYSDAEFFPGPRLNLVLGPNGTGKSSIVCALCIGLAGSPKLLGRADKVGSFVRHETDQGFVEVCLLLLLPLSLQPPEWITLRHSY